MDPHIIELITKIGAPGGLTALLAFLLYVLHAVYTDFKKAQDERIQDAKRYGEALLEQVDKNNLTFAKVAETVDKVSVADDKASVKILNEIEKLSLTVEDIEEAVKELSQKDKA